ncbi:MAG TPA: cation diffusion facilitator family transporter [Victivallales bacterium]|nr:cation diffusion facilitator family transporter [Victivallales bacterium]HPO89833.1 cation diffusion facilitator family transporter [Victivallales bacterium]HRR06934.1 cation diffusion facilitator family transporter [Victivallales bacterium]HRR28754.1 cation diffusion facilitator family transporter [Victivallales bacterium]
MDERNSINAINKVTISGLIINFLLCTIKIIAGIFGHSQAIVADAIHSLSDSATDIAVLIGARFWGKEPDSCHPYGHRKIEALVALFIAVSLAIIGVFLAYKAIITLPEKHSKPPGVIAFLTAIASIVVKESLYRWTILVGKKIKSSALIANAWHHRSDAFSSIPVAIAVAISAIAPEWSFLDHVATFAVSLFIIKASWKIAENPIQDILEAGLDKKILEEVKKLAFNVQGVRDIHKIRSRSVSSLYFIDMHVEVDPSLNIEQGHNIATEVKRILTSSGLGIIDVLVHIEPYGITTPSNEITDNTFSSFH